jgi:hypothetical protein
MIAGMVDRDVLRTGDRAVIRCARGHVLMQKGAPPLTLFVWVCAPRFRFLRQPEYLRTGDRLLFREGRTKGVGKVMRTIPVGSEEETPRALQRPSARMAAAAAAAAAATAVATASTGGAAPPATEPEPAEVVPSTTAAPAS